MAQWKKILRNYDRVTKIEYYSGKKLHRINGAAVIYNPDTENPEEEYWIRGVKYEKRDYWIKMCHTKGMRKSVCILNIL